MRSLPSSFWQWLSTLERHDQMPALLSVVGIAAVAVVLIVAICALFAYYVHRNRSNDALKRELLERGLPAEDVVAIVRATPARGPAADV